MIYINSSLRYLNIKLNKDVILIFLFLFVSLQEGIIPELIEVFILAKMLLRKNKYTTFIEKKIKNTLMLFSVLIVILFFFQIIFLELNGKQALYLFGIYKNLYIGIIIFLIGRNYLRKIDNYIAALSFFLMLLNIGTLITILLNFKSIDYRVSFLSYASNNYSTALSTICIPIYFYYFSNFKKKNRLGLNLINNIAIFLCFLVIIISGSRANIFFLTIEIVVIFFLNKKKIYNLFKTITFFIISYFLITYILNSINSEILALFYRGISVFENYHDSPRALIWHAATIQFQNSNKLLGSGSIIVQYYQKEAHNFIWEILLASGFTGLVIYIVYAIKYVIYLLKDLRIVDKFYILLTVMIAFGIGYVQPFITTGHIFNVLLWSLIIVMSFSGREKNSDEK